MTKPITKTQLNYLEARFNQVFGEYLQREHAKRIKEIEPLFVTEKKKLHELHERITKKAKEYNTKVGYDMISVPLDLSAHIPHVRYYSGVEPEKKFRDEFNKITLRLVLGEDISQDFTELLDKIR